MFLHFWGEILPFFFLTFNTYIFGGCVFSQQSRFGEIFLPNNTYKQHSILYHCKIHIDSICMIATANSYTCSNRGSNSIMNIK